MKTCYDDIHKRKLGIYETNALSRYKDIELKTKEVEPRKRK
jgi:hypothetical protein